MKVIGTLDNFIFNLCGEQSILNPQRLTVFTGKADAEPFTIYDIIGKNWHSDPEIVIRRGVRFRRSFDENRLSG